MLPGAIFLATLLAAVGSGLVAGIFYGFSSIVMPALGRLPPEQAIAAMQAINVAAINRWLLGALFGTGAACLAAAVGPLLAPGPGGAGLRVAGAMVYLAGAIGVTAACNVPRNDALARLSPDAPDAAGAWLRYLAEWTAWNHVRGAAALVAATLLTLGLLVARER